MYRFKISIAQVASVVSDAENSMKRGLFLLND